MTLPADFKDTEGVCPRKGRIGEKPAEQVSARAAAEGVTRGFSHVMV